MTDPVLIAGGGIGGLTLALTLHQIGVPVRVYEAARQMRPLGVGINLQPNAVRELIDLGIGTEVLDKVGLPIREWALLSQSGQEVHAEPRGRAAGYNWPQYGVHRGAFHMALYHEVIARLGADAVVLGARVTGYSQTSEGVTVDITDAEGATRSATGALLIGADGIHSRVRAQMHPDQPPIHWGGALMWRGTVRAPALRTGASFVGVGTHRHRMVLYPISAPDADGLSLINWIAELVVDATDGWQSDEWFRPVDVEDFAHHFQGFEYKGTDMPSFFAGSDAAYENPMIDRDPVPFWTEGRVALMGDAAHAMYPTGSNGASQAIVDARVLGARILDHGLGPEALAAYNTQLCAPISALVLRNREAGPFGLLDLLAARDPEGAGPIDDVLPLAERQAFLSGYRAAAGFDVETLNAAKPIIASGARI